MPHFIGLDSSHWTNLTRDLSSEQNRDEAQRRIAELLSLDGVLVLTWHHVLELIQHGDEALALARVEALRFLPVLATVACEPESVLGTIVHVLAQEVSVALHMPQATAVDIAGRVKPGLFVSVSGEVVCEAVLAHFAAYREHDLQRQPRQQELAVLTQTPVLNQPKQPFYLDGVLRSSSEVVAHSEALRSRLSEDVSRRKDRRMSRPEEAVDKFVDGLLASASAISQAPTPADGILAIGGLTRADVEGCGTMEDVGTLAVFRHQIKSPLTGDLLSLGVLRKLCGGL